jgi:hypothetical protein
MQLQTLKRYYTTEEYLELEAAAEYKANTGMEKFYL